MAAEAIAAPIMVAILAVFFHLFLRPQLLQTSKDQAENGLAGRMESSTSPDRLLDDVRREPVTFVADFLH
jgi:hypothetical protein